MLSDPLTDLCKVAEMVAAAKDFYNTRSYCLPSYYLKLYKDQLTDLEAKLKHRRGQNSQPVSFKFKRRVQKSADPPSDQQHAPLKHPETSQQDVKADQSFVYGTNDVSESLKISDMVRCRVEVPVKTKNVYLRNLTDCSVVTGLVEGSLFCFNLKNCHVQAISQQIRVHDSADTTFETFVLSSMIIEDCSQISVAELKEEALVTLVGSEQVRDRTNNWRSVQDFNWIKPGQSPNFKLLN